MFKHTYFLQYIVKPNRKTSGSEFATRMTFGKPLPDAFNGADVTANIEGEAGSLNELRKAILVLSKMHRVDASAVTIIGWEKVKRTFAFGEWMKKKLMGMVALFGPSRA